MARQKAKKIGRPPVPDHLKKRRNDRLVIMLWPDEKAALNKAAGGENVSTWVRTLALGKAGYE